MRNKILVYFISIFVFSCQIKEKQPVPKDKDNNIHAITLNSDTVPRNFGNINFDEFKDSLLAKKYEFEKSEFETKKEFQERIQNIKIAPNIKCGDLFFFQLLTNKSSSNLQPSQETNHYDAENKIYYSEIASGYLPNKTTGFVFLNYCNHLPSDFIVEHRFDFSEDGKTLFHSYSRLNIINEGNINRNHELSMPSSEAKEVNLSYLMIGYIDFSQLQYFEPQKEFIPGSSSDPLYVVSNDLILNFIVKEVWLFDENSRKVYIKEKY